MADQTFWQAFWASIVKTFKWIGVKLVAPGLGLIVVIVLVIGAVLLAATMGLKLPLGGLIAKLLGKPEPGQKAIAIANTIAKDRVDKDGNLIPIGTPDSKGDTQVQVVPIDEPGIFSNPDTVTFTPPGKTEPVEVKLPDGVKAKDVESVVIITPEVTAITVKDNTGLSTERIDDLLAKYGG